MTKDFAPKLREKQRAKDNEQKAMEVFAFIGMGTVAYIGLKIVVWITWGIYFLSQYING